MPFRNRGKSFAIVTAISALFIVTLWSVFVWKLSSKNVQYDKNADHYAAEYKANSEQDMKKACFSGAPVNIVECVTGYIEAQRSAYRDEHDLAAQEKMADWALGVLIASTLTLAATIVGAYFVWLSLRQTRQAISLDREIGQAQVRAYISVTSVTASLTEQRHFHIVLKVSNSGQSPAKRVHFICLHTIGFGSPDENGVVRADIPAYTPALPLPDIGVGSTVGSDVGHTFHDFQYAEASVQRAGAANVPLMFTVGVFALDVFGGKIWCFKEVFAVANPGRPPSGPSPDIHVMTERQMGSLKGKGWPDPYYRGEQD